MTEGKRRPFLSDDPKATRVLMEVKLTKMLRMQEIPRSSFLQSVFLVMISNSWYIMKRFLMRLVRLSTLLTVALAVLAAYGVMDLPVLQGYEGSMVVGSYLLLLVAGWFL